jgi:ATP/maltotriose-dependent transcriptional regulator MalT
MQAGNNQYESMENCHRLGMIMGFTGEIERGLELVAQAADYARQAGAEKIRLAAEISRGVLLNARGEVEQAIRVLQAVESEAGGRRILPIQLIASAYAARCMLSRRVDEAHQTAHHLIGLSQALGSPWLEMLGHRVAHAAGRQRGEAGAAHLARARKVLDDLSARITLAPLRPAYEAYRQVVLAELQPGDPAPQTGLAG